MIPADPTPIGHGLDRVLRGLGRAPHRAEQEIRERWLDYRNERGVAEAEIVTVTPKAIVIETTDAALASELRWSVDELASMLDPSGGRAVTVRVRRHPG